MLLQHIIAIIAGTFLILFSLNPIQPTPHHHFDFVDSFLLFAGLASFLYGVLHIAPINLSF
ncbi:MAG: hypothetical protein WC528_02450 [Patescibacteria group bacterium]